MMASFVKLCDGDTRAISLNVYSIDLHGGRSIIVLTSVLLKQRKGNIACHFHVVSVEN